MGTVYNSAAKSSAKQMKRLANFSESQRNEIDLRFAQFHSWHRQQHLPQYSQLLTDIADYIGAKQTVTPEITASWMQQVNDYSMEIRHCSPLNNSAELLSALSDSQVESIARETNKSHASRVQKYHRESKTKRSQRRQEEITNWASRAGLNLNAKQKSLLADTLEEQISLGRQRYYLQEQWIARFNQLLKNRNQPDARFTSSVNGHIKLLWTLTQDNYPDEWQASAQLWQNFLAKFLQLQTDRQNIKLTKKARKLAATLDSLSKDTKDIASPVCFGRSR